MIVAERPASESLRLQETSVSRGVRRNALVRASERHVKECPGILGVNERLQGVASIPAT
jgi:hypothetical protein